jgi:hypothetical protein
MFTTVDNYAKAIKFYAEALEKAKGRTLEKAVFRDLLKALEQVEYCPQALQAGLASYVRIKGSSTVEMLLDLLDDLGFARSPLSSCEHHSVEALLRVQAPAFPALQHLFDVALSCWTAAEKRMLSEFERKTLVCALQALRCEGVYLPL